MEIVRFQPFEYAVCQLLSVSFYMFLIGFTFSWPCVYGYVIHVDRDVSFVNEVAENCVHHRLEGSW